MSISFSCCENRIAALGFPTGRRGFTLIEMAIVVMIIGVIISIVSTVLPSLVRTSKIKQAQATLEKVDYALQGYILANGQLPLAPIRTPRRTGLENRLAGVNPPTGRHLHGLCRQPPVCHTGPSVRAPTPGKIPSVTAFIRVWYALRNPVCATRCLCTPCLGRFRQQPPPAAGSAPTMEASSPTPPSCLPSGGGKDMDGGRRFF